MDYKQYIQKNNIDLAKEDITFDLGNFITEARLYVGITQSELAKKMGTKQSSIARAENGTVTPSVRFLKRVTESVGLTFLPPKIREVENLKNQNNNNHSIVYFANFDTPSITKPIVNNINASPSTIGMKVSPI